MKLGIDAGMEDTLHRRGLYVDAGANAIMIHSRRDSGEILEFAAFRQEFPLVPFVCVPRTYHHLTFSQLEDAGLSDTIYANHMLRSAYRAMKQVSEAMLREGRSYEVESLCLSVDEILTLIPEQPGHTQAASALPSSIRLSS